MEEMTVLDWLKDGNTGGGGDGRKGMQVGNDGRRALVEVSEASWR